MNKVDEFKAELKALLEKYNAAIACDIDGDTHCVSMTMVVEIDRHDYILCNGSSVDKSDIR
jgi:hypothetical protein